MAAAGPEGSAREGGYKTRCSRHRSRTGLPGPPRHRRADRSMPWRSRGTPDDPESAPEFSRMINEGNAELIGKHPDRFGAFATLPADGPDQALAELTHALDELRLDGVVLDLQHAGPLLRRPGPGTGTRRAGPRQVPVFVHPETDCPSIESSASAPESSIVDSPSTPRAPSPTRSTPASSSAIRTTVDTWPMRRRTAHPRLANRRTHPSWPRPRRRDIDPTHVAHVLRGLYYETARAGSRNSLLPTLEVHHPGPHPVRQRLASSSRTAT